jgi:hypothetical protein
VVIAFIAGVSSLVWAQSPKSEAAADIANLLKRHDAAMNQRDVDGVVQLYARGPTTVLLGTGPGEKYQGLEEIDKGTLSASCYWKDGGVTGTAAWGAAMCKISDSLGSKKREYQTVMDKSVADKSMVETA